MHASPLSIAASLLLDVKGDRNFFRGKSTLALRSLLYTPATSCCSLLLTDCACITTSQLYDILVYLLCTSASLVSDVTTLL